MSVAAMGARDVVVPPQGLTNPDCHGFLSDVEVRKTRHEGAGIELIDLFFKQTNPQHLLVHTKPELNIRFAGCLSSVHGCRHGVKSFLQWNLARIVEKPASFNARRPFSPSALQCRKYGTS